VNNTLFALLLRKQDRRSEHVFHRDRKKLRADYVSHLFKRYVRRLGPDERLHLRHRFASLLVLNGTSLYQVQKLMGHSDPRTTAGDSHLPPETMHDIVDRIQLPSD